MAFWHQPRLTRRLLLGTGILGTGTFLGQRLAAMAGAQAQPDPPSYRRKGSEHSAATHGGTTTVRDVNNTRNGFDPQALLVDWDTGEASKLPDGRTLRDYDIFVEERLIEIAPGVSYPAWTYNGRVPGPTLRVIEGDRVRIRFTNRGTHPHTIHFHGIHSARQDGVPGVLEALPGQTVTYEFDAKPFGCHLYHCHSAPFKRHLHKGLYGAFIIDPDPRRHPQQEKAAQSRLLGSPENRQWQEFVMVMNAFDTNFDDENEFYAINTIPHEFMKRPIPIQRNRPVRIYLVNVTEFDPINSFHLHANFFNYYDQGTTLTPTLKTVDTVMLCQGQRGILEFSFAEHEPGIYMFHAHQSEFVELGWMSAFEVMA